MKQFAISLIVLGLASSSSLYGDILDTRVFSKRITVTFIGVESGVTLADFPALVRLSTDIEGFSYDDFKGTSGADLRFADSAGNLIPHEIDTWNPSGVSTVWVKVPSLTQGAVVTAYYGSTATLPEVVAKDVWDDNYVGVWHLGEGSLPIKDSSATGLNVTQSSGTVGFGTAGAVGGSVDFGKYNKKNLIYAPDHAALDGFSQCTFEAWTYQTTHAQNAGVFAKRASYNNNVSYQIYDSGDASATISLTMGTTTGNSVPTGAGVAATLNAWNYVSFTFNSGAVNAYKNGAASGDTKTFSAQTVLVGTGPLCIGSFDSGDARNFPGSIDEVRISNVARSASWIKATHDTIALADFAYYEVLSYQPDDTQWYTNGVIACSTPDYTRESGDSYVYVFTTNCVVVALTNLHLAAISQSSAGETDYGYFQPGETREIVSSVGTMLSLKAEPVDLDSISSAEVTPAGGYTETREGAYTIYTFTGSGSIAVDKPGVADVEIVGPGGGETVTLRRLILNKGTPVVISDTIAGIGRYMVGAGTEEGAAGYVVVRVWKVTVLSVDTVGVSKATLKWGVTPIEHTVNVRLRHGPSRVVLTNFVVLAEGVSTVAGGVAEIIGLDPETKYYAQLQVDDGSGFMSVGEIVSFTTEALLPKLTGGKEVFVGEPVTPGLKAGFANTNYIDIATTDSKFRWLDNLELGIIAATNATSTLSDTGCPPIWANNRVWVFSGCMYFDGEHYYQFGEAIDDAVKVYIDGSQLFSDAGWNSWGSGCKKPTEGWHSVEFRFSNATGGAGISKNWKAGTVQRTDKNGRDCGFGWGKSMTNTKPANMSTLEWLCDPGDGSLLRPEMPKEVYLSVNGFEVDESQYNVSISNLSEAATCGKIFYGWSSDINIITNSMLMTDFCIEARGVTAIELVWEEDQPPNCVIVIPDVGVSDVISLTASPRVAASVKSVGCDFAVVTTATGFDIDISGDAPHLGLTAYFGPVDAGTSESGWESSQPFGTVKAGTHDFTLQNLAAGSSYMLRINATDENGNSAWSDPILLSMPAPAEVPRRGRIVIIR